MRLSEIVDLYLGDVARRCSDRTLLKYTQELDTFVDFLGGNYPVENIRPEQCLEFLNKWNNAAPKTQGSKWTALNQMFDMALRFDYIERNPMMKIPYPRVPNPEDRGVKSITFKDVQRVMSECHTWTEKLCLGTLVYMGVRRAAANNLRWKDVDLEEGYIRFKEKGGKYIRKPIPKPLFELLIAYRSLTPGNQGGGGLAGEALPEIAATLPGVSADDYVIPSDGPTHSELRNDRFIWRVVKRVCERAGVDAHCHAFRAAFAVHYLETFDGDTIGLQNLMGHSQIATTQGYWRRLNKERSMEKNRDLDWGVSLTEGSEPTLVEAHNGGRMRSAPLPSVSEDDSAKYQSHIKPTEHEMEIRERVVSPAQIEKELRRQEKRPVHSEPSSPAAEHIGALPKEILDLIPEDDPLSHIDEAERRSNSRTSSKLRGKDSNLDSQPSLKGSKVPRVKAPRDRERSR